MFQWDLDLTPLRSQHKANIIKPSQMPPGLKDPWLSDDLTSSDHSQEESDVSEEYEADSIQELSGRKCCPLLRRILERNVQLPFLKRGFSNIQRILPLDLSPTRSGSSTEAKGPLTPIQHSSLQLGKGPKRGLWARGPKYPDSKTPFPKCLIGHLQNFAGQWRLTMTDLWVLES